MEAIETIFRFNNFPITGIIHVGACTGEELEEYTNNGVKKVIWIEPNPNNYKELVNNVKDSGIENYTFEYACADTDDLDIDFHVLYDPGNKGCSSLFYPKSRIIGMYQETIKVKSIRLDTLMENNNFDLDHFQLLDMDTQGAEIMVMQGASKVLNHVNYVCAELTFDSIDYHDVPMSEQIINFLDLNGFAHVGTQMGESHWGDGYFVRRSLL
jgi:FkbM family methyltransferase